MKHLLTITIVAALTAWITIANASLPPPACCTYCTKARSHFTCMGFCNAQCKGRNRLVCYEHCDSTWSRGPQ